MKETTHQSFSNFDNGDETCPVFANPEPDCYCVDMTSMKIPYAVKFCLGDFRQCDVYQRVVKQKWSGAFVAESDICPVLNNPDPACYCLDMTSMTIPYAIRYCLRDFRQCDVYQRLMQR